MSQITIYGASDDLIEIEGDILEEFNFYPRGEESRILAVSDGTLLRVYYDKDGIWRLNKISGGSADFQKIEGDVEKDTPDKVVLSGVSFRWVVMGEGLALPSRT